MWGSLQICGVTGGGEGVDDVSPRVRAGSRVVKNDLPQEPRCFCGKSRRVLTLTSTGSLPMVRSQVSARRSSDDNCALEIWGQLSAIRRCAAHDALYMPTFYISPLPRTLATDACTLGMMHIRPDSLRQRRDSACGAHWTGSPSISNSAAANDHETQTHSSTALVTTEIRVDHGFAT